MSNTTFNAEPQEQSFPIFVTAFFALVLGLIVGASAMSVYRDRQETTQAAAQVEHKPVVIGNGATLTAPGLSVLIGPATVDHEIAKLPVYVQENKASDYVMTCLLLDARKRLVAGGGVHVPPQFVGTDLNVAIGRDIDAGSVQCRLAKP